MDAHNLSACLHRLATGDLHAQDDLARATTAALTTASSPAGAAAGGTIEHETLKQCEVSLRNRTVVIDVAHAATAVQVRVQAANFRSIQLVLPKGICSFPDRLTAKTPLSVPLAYHASRHLCLHVIHALGDTSGNPVQVYESCMALGMLPTMQACTPRNASCEFAIVGDAATAIAAIRYHSFSPTPGCCSPAGKDFTANLKHCWCLQSCS